MLILALDLGKFNTMCCFFDTNTRNHSFLNATTDHNYLTTVFKKHKIDLVFLESCGPQAGSTILPRASVSMPCRPLDGRTRSRTYTYPAVEHCHQLTLTYRNGLIHVESRETSDTSP